MDNKKFSNFEKNLISFLRLFQNRPLHLAKYLIEKNCLSSDFIENVSQSKKLDDLTEKYEYSEIPTIYFSNFKEMLKFFENISNQYNLEDITSEKVQKELNDKLDHLIKTEQFEEAIKIRDFMIQNNLKRNT